MVLVGKAHQRFRRDGGRFALAPTLPAPICQLAVASLAGSQLLVDYMLKGGDPGTGRGMSSGF
jgi:hypothetical protein